MKNIKNKIIRWLKIQIGFYCLRDDDIYLWQSIRNKGSHTFDYIELNESEIKLLYEIHDEIMGDDWYIADPLGAKQVHYIMYKNVKNKVVW